VCCTVTTSTFHSSAALLFNAFTLSERAQKSALANCSLAPPVTFPRDLGLVSRSQLTYRYFVPLWDVLCPGRSRTRALRSHLTSRRTKWGRSPQSCRPRYVVGQDTRLSYQDSIGCNHTTINFMTARLVWDHEANNVSRLHGAKHAIQIPLGSCHTIGGWPWEGIDSLSGCRDIHIHGWKKCADDIGMERCFS